jgi:Domain of unknown function (DUF4276)
MNIGIVVEGPSDGAVYRTLIRRIRNDIDKLQVRECGGKYRLKNMFLGFLKEFQRNHAWQINVAFVIRDSDCKPPQPIEVDLRNVLHRSGFAPQFPIEFFATKCQLETWLLADENAINQVSQRRGKNLRVGPVEIQFEIDNSAKKHFMAQLSKVRLPASPQVYKDVADIADIARIAERCPSFQQFIDRVRAH